MALEPEDNDKHDALRRIFEACQSYYDKNKASIDGERVLFVIAMDRAQNPTRHDGINFRLNAIQAIDRGKFNLEGTPCFKVGRSPSNATQLASGLMTSDMELLEHLENSGLKNAPLLEADFECGKCRVHLYGLEEDEGCCDWYFNDEPAYLNDCEDLLRLFHEDFTNFPRPTAPGKYWIKASDYSVCQYFEAAIQKDLYAYLRGKFSTSFCMNSFSESDTEFGRCDIKITYTDPSGGVHMVAIELKAIRDRTRASVKSNYTAYNDTQNRDGIEKGLRQATFYNQDPTIQAAFLAVWNARSKEHDDWQSEFEKEANARDIGFGWYRMCRTQEEWRLENDIKPKALKM